MDISFDPAKDARNIARRGLSLARAADFDWASALIVEDARRDYREQRFQALGFIDDRLAHAGIHASRRQDPCHQSAQGQS
ncbi:MAG: BrnT family toxin [Chromatiales bacterium]